jgi:dipeptidyl aminopeptidase/acylaminoacyl peptidase
MPQLPYRRFILLVLGYLFLKSGIYAQTLTQSDLIDAFRPWRVEHVTLSPDGTHLACSINDEDSTSIEIIDINHPQKPILLKVEENRLGSNWWSVQASAKRVSFIGWAGNHRLIVLSSLDGLFAIDPDGNNQIKLGDAKSLGYSEYPRQRSNNTTKLGKENNSGIPDEKNYNFTRDDAEPRLIPRKLNVLWVPTSDTSWITVSATGKVTDVYRINTETAAKEIIYNETGAKNTILTDHAGFPRLELVAPNTEYSKTYSLINTKEKNKILYFKSIATTITPNNYLGIRSIPTAVDNNPDIIYYATNENTNVYAVYSIDLTTGTKKRISQSSYVEDVIDPLKAFDAQRLIFDPKDGSLSGIHYPNGTTQWMDKEVASIQVRLEREIPHRTITINQWDNSHEHFLFTSSSIQEPGRYFLYTKSTNEIIQYFRRAPWIDLDTLSPEENITIPLKDGSTVACKFTQTLNFKVNPAPLLIILHDGPANRDKQDFDREAQLFAHLGVNVARINYRSSSGKGLSYQNDYVHSLPTSLNEDLLGTIGFLASHKKIDPKRIILMGTGLGGTLALRTAQLNPGRFKGVITVNTPTDIKGWINTALKEPQDRIETKDSASMDKKGGKGGKMNMKSFMQDTTPRSSSRPQQPVDFEQAVRKSYFNLSSAELKTLSPINHTSESIDPVLMIQDIYGRPVTLDQEQAFIEKIKLNNTQAYVYEMQGSLYSIEPEARLNAYRTIEQFLNLTLYNYSVNIGELKEKN